MMAFATTDSKEILSRKIVELKQRLADADQNNQKLKVQAQGQEEHSLGLLDKNRDLQLQLNGVNSLLR